MSTSLTAKVRSAFSALCWNIGTPVAYKALLAMEREDWKGLTSVKVQVGKYTCPRTLSGDLQIAAFFKKYPGFDLGIDLDKKASDSFFESERQCYWSNERLSPLLHDPRIYGEGVYRYLSDVRKEVSRVLGRCPKPASIKGRFGPGSTFRDVGSLVTVPDKLSSRYTLTTQARVFLHAWDQTAWSRYAAAGLEPWKQSGLLGHDEIAPGLSQNDVDRYYAPVCEDIVRGNRFTTVPKDAWKKRGICVEPSVNVFYQLGIGQLMTKRMATSINWVKEEQQEFHKLLARLGSLTGSLATLDLSNASDTVCKVLVELLLPPDWFQLLYSLRSPNTFIGGKWVRLEKFSSMGNGFTFELETLIFYCLTAVACRKTRQQPDFHGTTVSVFGDDIICPSDCSRDVIAILKFFGFALNEEKSFTKGGFRESCGGDYFRGLDVRPHYLKEEPCEPHHFIALANGISRFRIRHTLCGGRDVAKLSWLRILDCLPVQIRGCRGPEGLGDLVIHDREESWRCVTRSSIRYFRVWRPVPFRRTAWSHFRPGVVLASALYGTGDGADYRSLTGPRNWAAKAVPGGIPLRVITEEGVLSRVNGSYVSGYRFGRVAFS